MQKKAVQNLIRAFNKRFHFIFSPFERKLQKKYSFKKNNKPIIFIIGLPRSGSTILYQTLTNFLDVTYVSNLVDSFREKPLTGFKIHQIFFDGKPHNNFSSNFGKTKSLIAPSEGMLWYNWLPRRRHYVVPEDISPEKRDDFINTMNAVLNMFDKPLLIKNLAFSVKLKLIKQFFPNSKLIYIKRNLLFNAQSLFLAYRKNNIPEDSIWSIKPPDYQKILNLDLHKKVVWQMFLLQEEIEKNINLFARKIYLLKYEDFTSKPKEKIKEIADFLQIPMRKNTSLNTLIVKNNNIIRLEDIELQKLKNSLNEVYGI